MPEEGEQQIGAERRVGLALLAVWGILAFVIAARRPDPASVRTLPDRPTAPLTIDLNRDPWPRLLLIEGIGEALAQRIVETRAATGGFTTFDEVKAIPGVPDGAIDRARPWLTLGALPDPGRSETNSSESPNRRTPIGE